MTPIPARYDVRPSGEKWAVFDTFTQEPVVGELHTYKAHATVSCASHNRAYNDAMRDE